jgi:hypothetical protein
MQKVFFVRHRRDNMPYLLVTVRAGATDFQPLSEEADDVADVFDSVYKNRPITKQELDAALDDDFTIEGPINPTRGNLNLLQDFLADANQPLSPKKLAPSAKSFDISSVPLGFSDDDGKINLTEYKARNFLYEQTKTTFNYEVKRVRAIWDSSLSIPGTGRRGGWRCPVGTRYGGQITDRFGRNCGWGVARRIANAITNIGERMESIDDRRRGRRVERRNRRMLERIGRAEGEGRAERGLRGVAEVLDGGDEAPPREAARPRGRGAQARRRARNTTEALADARDRGLRDSERRRVRRELEKPGAPRTDEKPPRDEKPEAKKPKAPRKLPRNARKPAARRRGEERNAQDRPIDGPNETEDYSAYINRKYDEYAENVRKIRERGGRAGFLTRREWYDINKENLDDAWRKKGKGDAPADFLPPTPVKKRRRQPGARKKPERREKPPVADKEPDSPKRDDKKLALNPGEEEAKELFPDDWFKDLDNDEQERLKNNFVEAFINEGQNITQVLGDGHRYGEATPGQELLADWQADPDGEMAGRAKYIQSQIDSLSDEEKKLAKQIVQLRRDDQNVAGQMNVGALDEIGRRTLARKAGRRARLVHERQRLQDILKNGLDGVEEELQNRRGVDAPEPKPNIQAPEGGKGFDAEKQVDAIINVFGESIDTNEKAQLLRGYREQQKEQENINKQLAEDVDKLLADEKLDDAELIVKQREDDILRAIEQLKKDQDEAVLNARALARGNRLDILREVAKNAAKFDGLQARLRYAQAQKKNIADAKAALNVKPKNDVADFDKVPFKVYAAEVSEPNRGKFVLEANDRADARAEMRLMLGEAFRREEAKWEKGERKKPKMMIAYHDGKAYVIEYGEFTKMSPALQEAQIRKGLIIWNAEGGMSESISRNLGLAREELLNRFDKDFEKGELKPAAEKILQKFPRAKILAEGNGKVGIDAEGALQELRIMRMEMNADFKDFPDFRVVELRDEDDGYLVVAIPDEDFRGINTENIKFKKNATKLAVLDKRDAPTRPRKNVPKPQNPDAAEDNPIGNPFVPKVDERLDFNIQFGEKGIGEYRPIVNPRIRDANDAIKFIKDGGDLSKVPHEYWHAAVEANSSRDKNDTTTRFRLLSRNGGAIGDTRIYVLRDAEGFGTNKGIVFKGSSDNDNLGELVGWNLMNQMGILKGGAVGDGRNRNAAQYVVFPFAFNDVPDGNNLTAFGADPGQGNYPITEINRNIPNKNKPQMFAARLNQELLNFVLAVDDRHRGNGMAKAVELPNGEHMAHVIPIDLGWAGRRVLNDPLSAGGVDDRFWTDLDRAIQQADVTEKIRIKKSIIAAWDNAIEKIGNVLDVGKEEFVRDAVKNIDSPATRLGAERLYEVMVKQRNKLINNRNALLVKIRA